MRPIIIILLLNCFSSLSFGQGDFNKANSYYFELGGSGGFGSLNFERPFATNNSTLFTWRAGLSIAPIDKNNGVGLVFPLMINAIVGQNSHKLELGLGQGITVTTKGDFFSLTPVLVGYRFQKATKAIFYRVSYTPLISYLFDFQIQQWAGLSIGYTFKKS